MAAHVAGLELQATGEPGQWSLRGTGLVLLRREGGWTISTMSLNASEWLRDHGPTDARFDRRADAVRAAHALAPAPAFEPPLPVRRDPHSGYVSRDGLLRFTRRDDAGTFIGVPARWEAHSTPRATGVARCVTCAPTLSLLRSYVRAYHADLRRRLELD
jgi:hypothetical protein